MKISLMAGAVLLAALTSASARQTDDELQAKTIRRARESLVVVKTEKVNQFVKHNRTYSGVAVALVRADNPAQLLNPFAPEEYGTSEDSVVRDPITREASGVKIFSIKF